MTKILVTIIVILLTGWGVWKFWPDQPRVMQITDRPIYADDEIEVKNNQQDYIVWRMPDKITDDTLYAYKLYPDDDCQLMYIFENENPA